MAVIPAPPSFVITPPLVPELIVIFVTSLVVNVGITGSFLQLLIIANTNKKHTKRTIDFFILKHI
jgi:hypothetical protein